MCFPRLLPGLELLDDLAAVGSIRLEEARAFDELDGLADLEALRARPAAPRRARGGAPSCRPSRRRSRRCAGAWRRRRGSSRAPSGAARPRRSDRRTRASTSAMRPAISLRSGRRFSRRRSSAIAAFQSRRAMARSRSTSESASSFLRRVGDLVGLRERAVLFERRDVERDGVAIVGEALREILHACAFAPRASRACRRRARAAR